MGSGQIRLFGLLLNAAIIWEVADSEAFCFVALPITWEQDIR